MRRRTFVAGISAVASSLAWPAFAQTQSRTPGQILGPYYPVVKPGEADVDLTRMARRSGRATGQLLRVAGRVLNEEGQAVPHAEIEVWQADSAGHYRHSSDRTGEVDPNFQGYSALTADREGRYQFTTIKPAAYLDDGAGGMRAPHIHFQVTGRINRLVTQMYFPGERLNETDRVMAFAQGNRSRLIAQLSSGSDGLLVATWDIVLREG